MLREQLVLTTNKLKMSPDRPCYSTSTKARAHSARYTAKASFSKRPRVTEWEAVCVFESTQLWEKKKDGIPTLSESSNEQWCR